MPDLEHAAEVLLKCLHSDGYSLGESKALTREGTTIWVLDASKDGERWVVKAEEKFDAAYELAAWLGWDFDDI